VPVALTVLDSPFRDLTGPVLDHLAELRRAHPHDVLSVYIPEYVVSRWWENLLHNQSALRLKARLLFEPGLMVTNVPWRIPSTDPDSPVGVAGYEPDGERTDAAAVAR
jgi:hypothetical protein